MINALKAALLFCEIDQIESRKSLAGVHFEFIPDGVRIISMTSFYGIAIEVEAQHGNTPGDTATIYREYVVQILKLLQAEKENPTLAATDEGLWVICGGARPLYPGMDSGLFGQWERVLDLEGVKPEAEIHAFNPDFLITICKAFNYLLGKNRIIKYTAGSASLRSVFTIPPSHLKPGILSAQAVIMPIRP